MTRKRTPAEHTMDGEEDLFAHMVKTHLDGIRASDRPLDEERDDYQWVIDNAHEDEPHKADGWWMWFRKQVAAEVIRQLDAMLAAQKGTRMIRRAILVALLASLLTEPVIAHDDAMTVIPVRGHDTAVQVEYVDFIRDHEYDPRLHIFEDDGSAALIDPSGCYQDSITGRVALRDC